MLAKWINLIKTDIWRIRPKDHTPGKSLLIRYTQIMILTIRSFYENKCKFKASALTYYSLLSIVPVIALMFGIAKGFGLQKQVEQQLLAKMQGQTEIVTKIIAFANSLLENANGGFIAGIGVAFLFYTIIKVLSNIENSFNDIWGIIKPRSFGRKFGDYLSTMLVCPILLVIAGSMTIFVSTQIEFITEKIPLLKNFGPLFWLLLKILPFAAVWIVFTFIFIFMPNTKVRFKSAVVGGIVAGTIFQIAQFVYVYFQIGMNKYGAIYGSFAALPLFLLWLQAGWLIVLFGAEVSFAHQNVETYEFEPDCLSASHSFKTLLSLFITQQLVHSFCNGEKPSDASKLSHELDIPVRLVRELLYELSESGILSETTKGQNKELAFQPAIDTDKITIKFVIDQLEKRGSTDIPVIKSTEFDKLSDSLRQFDTAIKNSQANILLKNV